MHMYMCVCISNVCSTHPLCKVPRIVLMCFAVITGVLIELQAALCVHACQLPLLSLILTYESTCVCIVAGSHKVSTHRETALIVAGVSLTG